MFKYFASGGSAAATAPVITAIATDAGDSSSDGITNDQTLTISGTSIASAIIEVFKDAVSIGNTTANGSGVWSFNHTGTTLSAGSYAFTAKATSASAQSSASSTFTVLVDVTVPTASVAYSVAGPYKSGTAVTLTFTFSEAMASNVTPKIAMSGSQTLSATNLTRVTSTSYTYAHTVGSGNGTTTLALSIGTDLAGNAVTSAPTSGSTFTVDNTAPTVTITSSAGASGSTTLTSPTTFTFTFSEAVTLFVVGDITVTGTASATKGNFSGSGTTYTCDLTPATDGTIIIDVASGVCVDAAGNTNTAASQFTVTYTSNPFASQSTNTWVGYSNTSLNPDSAGINPDPAVSSGSPLTAPQWIAMCPAGNNSGLFRAWGSGCYDSSRKRMWFMGWGHTDGYLMHLVCWDLQTQAYQHFNWPDVAPTVLTDLDDGYLDAGNTIPAPRHPYNGIEYLPNVDRIYVSGAYTGPNGTYKGKHWLFNPNNATWTQLPDSNAGSDGENAAVNARYDSVTGLLFIRTRTQLWTLDPTNTGAGWTSRYNWGGSYGQDYSDVYRTMAIDTVNRRIILTGGGEVWTHDISNLAAVTSSNGDESGWSGSGLAALKASNVAGMDYDTTKSQLVAWSGGQTIYIVDPIAKTVTTETMNGLDTPEATQTQGTFGRFRYSPEFNRFIAMNGCTSSGGVTWYPSYIGKRA